ncbi:MAG: four helix bundle protein [Anaerolineae bacterium]|nr:four helix bundle protein [Caldilineales bacterium]MDW8267899.1 four helix bundle protein [Anaerolineae bacterium]
MELEDLHVLRAAEALADDIWQEVSAWEKFSQDVVGKQLAHAADSVGANIAEAYGRYHYGDKLQFLYYARGSLFETKYWINRALTRKLIKDEKIHDYIQRITDIARKLNAFTAIIRKHRSSKNISSLYEKPLIYETVDDSLFTTSELNWLEYPPGH